MLAINGKGNIPALNTAIYPCLIVGSVMELINEGMVLKDEKGKLSVAKEFENNFTYLSPLYAFIAEKSVYVHELFHTKQLKEVTIAIRDTLISKDCKDILTHQGVFKNKTKYVSKPEIVQKIIARIHDQFFGDEPLDDKTACLVTLLDVSGLIRDYFGKIDAKLLKKQLEELPEREIQKLLAENLGDDFGGISI